MLNNERKTSHPLGLPSVLWKGNEKPQNVKQFYERYDNFLKKVEHRLIQLEENIHAIVDETRVRNY